MFRWRLSRRLGLLATNSSINYTWLSRHWTILLSIKKNVLLSRSFMIAFSFSWSFIRKREVLRLTYCLLAWMKRPKDARVGFSFQQGMSKRTRQEHAKTRKTHGRTLQARVIEILGTPGWVTGHSLISPQAHVSNSRALWTDISCWEESRD
jgi:hypothetical protein